jgi:hypothetical protein
MKSFLERWAEGETESPGRGRNGEEPVTSVEVTSEMAESRKSPSKSLEEWKAAELNRLLEKQGLAGNVGRLRPETARDGNNRGTGNEPSTMGCEPQGGFPPNDPNTTQARSEVAGLLAIACRRYAEVQCVAEDQRKDLADSKLALRGEPSVHGVVP